MDLKERYNEVVMAYITLFEEKQGLELEFWVADQVGEIASFGCVYYYNFCDIKRDIDLEIPKHTIIDWLEWRLEDEERIVNYWSYLLAKGLIKKE